MTVEVRDVLTVSAWRACQHVYDFMGTSIVEPLSKTGDVLGIMPTFWGNAPEPDNESGREGLMRLRNYAAVAHDNDAGNPSRADIPGICNIERERRYLFWNKPHVVTVPYEPEPDAVTMAELYVEAGLKMEQGRYAGERRLDIELAYLAHLCGVAADDMVVASAENRDARKAVLPTAQKVAWFIEKFPLSWLDELREQVDRACPEGYYSALFEYLQGLLEHQLAELSR